MNVFHLAVQSSYIHMVCFPLRVLWPHMAMVVRAKWCVSGSLKCMWRNKVSHEDCGWEGNVFINCKVDEFQRIDLATHGFYSTPDIVFDWLLYTLEAVYRIIFRFVVYFPLFWSSKFCFLNQHLIRWVWEIFVCCSFYDFSKY